MTYNRQLNLHHDQTTAMFNTLQAQGRPIICVPLALAAGFVSLSVSNFVPTVHFGLLAAGVMLMAMFGELADPDADVLDPAGHPVGPDSHTDGPRVVRTAPSCRD